MFRFAPAIAATMLTLPAVGQELLPRYSVMGTVTVTVDGTEHDLVIPFDTDNDSASAEENNFMGRRSVNFVAYSVGDDGEPASPMLQLTFWVTDGAGDILSAEFFDQGYDAPLAVESDEGTVAFSAFSITEANEIEASFAGEFLRMENYMSAPAIAPDATPVAFSGTVVVTVPKPE